MTKKTEVKCDVGGIQARLYQVGDRAAKGVSDVLRDYGEIIAHQAVLNAPRDSGSLEAAIDVKAERDARNRIQVKIYIKRTVPHFEDEGKMVGDYAWEMERGLAPHGSGEYSAGPKTRAKGSQAGGRFLERAIERYRQEVYQKARRIIKRVTG